MSLYTQPKLDSSAWQHGYIQTNGVRLHYVTEGEGPLIVLLHGFPEFWYSWRYQLPVLARDHRVVALDLRGYNDSDKPSQVAAYRMDELVADVIGVAQGLGYDRFTLVGHDWGGAIAWNLADRHPEYLDNLIVLNLPHPARLLAGLRTPQQLIKSWYIFFFQLPWLPELALQWANYRAVELAFSAMAIDKKAFSPSDLDAFKQAAAKRGAVPAMLNYYRSIFSPGQLTRKWRVLEMPTLMIWGENDAALGKELTYGTEQYVRDLQIKYIPNCSHWVQQERPDLVNRYICDFLAE